LVKSCNDLFQTDKNPTDESMREAIYTALANDHPDEVKKIEKTKDEWYKYWTEVLQSSVTYFYLIIVDYLYQNYNIIILLLE
jgi:hypothetical protein